MTVNTRGIDRPSRLICPICTGSDGGCRIIAAGICCWSFTAICPDCRAASICRSCGSSPAELLRRQIEVAVVTFEQLVAGAGLCGGNAIALAVADRQPSVSCSGPMAWTAARRAK